MFGPVLDVAQLKVIGRMVQVPSIPAITRPLWEEQKRSENMSDKKNVDRKQTRVEDFLAEFTVSDPNPNRDVWTPVRDEVHTVTLTDWRTVENQYGESIMNTGIIGGEEVVWFCKGFENTDMRNWLSDSLPVLPTLVQFVRTQNQSTKNADRMVNRLYIKAVEIE